MDPAIIAATTEQYTANPEGARSTPAVNARLADGRAELTAGKFTWFADLPPALGGTATAPSPTAYLLGALAGCAIAFLHDTLGPQLGIRIDDVQAVAKCSTDARGLLGFEGVAPDLQDIEIEITISSPDGPDALARLEQVWRERCPIYLAIAGSNSVSVRVSATAGAA